MKELKEAVDRAYKVTKASSRHVMQKAKLTPIKAYVNSYKKKVKLDIEDVSFEKIRNLIKWEKETCINESIIR